MDIVKEPYRKGKREGKSSVLSLRVKQSTIEKIEFISNSLDLKRSDVCEAGVELFLTLLAFRNFETIDTDTLINAINRGINE